MSKENILVIVAHPDDEILGCGATMANHIKNGDSVQVVIMAEGLTSRDEQRDCEKRGQELSELIQQSRKANAILGVENVHFEKFPDNRMDSVDLLDVVKIVEKHIQVVKPSIVYTHHSGDVNIDHRIVHSAIVTACRPTPGQCVKTILSFEVSSSTEWQPPGSSTYFTPNWFVDISDTLELKLKALNEYKTEMRLWPHSRSVKALDYLAKWRGATIGVEAAEAFYLGRNILGGKNE